MDANFNRILNAVSLSLSHYMVLTSLYGLN